MAEIEITTTGELIMDDEVIGTITFTKPSIESNVAGVYHPETDADWDGFFDGPDE